MFIIKDELSRNEFNSLAGSISIIYILDSGYNVIGADMDNLMLGLYCGIYGLCFLSNLLTCRMIQTQQTVVRALNVPEMDDACVIKRQMFLWFTAILHAYFAFELLIHVLLGDFTAWFSSARNIQYTIWVSLHESFEVIFIGLIFYLYRAKDRGLFFNFLQDEEPPLSAVVVPYYKARSEPNGDLSEGPLLLMMPSFDADMQQPLQHVRLGMSTSRGARERSSVREVEMQERL
jgi:hypothetical protein